jgi:hypothetical protein
VSAPLITAPGFYPNPETIDSLPEARSIRAAANARKIELKGQQA